MDGTASTQSTGEIVSDVLDVVSGNKPVQTSNRVFLDIEMKTIGRIALGVILIALSIKVSQMLFGT